MSLCTRCEANVVLLVVQFVAGLKRQVVLKYFSTITQINDKISITIMAVRMVVTRNM